MMVGTGIVVAIGLASVAGLRGERAEPAMSEASGRALPGVVDAGRLFEAIRSDDLDEVSALLDAGVDPDAMIANGITPIMAASLRGGADIVARLVEAGASIDAANGFGSTPLQLAAQHGQVDVIGVLLAAGADVDARGDDPWSVTPLMEAARFGQSGVVAALLRGGADPEIRDGFGRPALMYALDAANTREVVVEFLDLGVRIAHPGGDTSLDIVVDRHDIDDLVEILAAADVRVSR